MLARPGYWERYYGGDEETRRLARVYSFSDRLRYYWPDPEVDGAVRRLLANLERVEIPLPLLAAWLPLEYARVRAGELDPGAPRARARPRRRGAARLPARLRAQSDVSP